MRMIFGSFVILTDELAERASITGDEDAPQDLIEAAISQAADQESQLEGRPYADLRYGTIGLFSGLLNNAQGSAGRISQATDVYRAPTAARHEAAE